MLDLPYTTILTYNYTKLQFGAYHESGREKQQTFRPNGRSKELLQLMINMALNDPIVHRSLQSRPIRLFKTPVQRIGGIISK